MKIDKICSDDDNYIGSRCYSWRKASKIEVSTSPRNKKQKKKNPKGSILSSESSASSSFTDEKEEQLIKMNKPQLKQKLESSVSIRSLTYLLQVSMEENALTFQLTNFSTTNIYRKSYTVQLIQPFKVSFLYNLKEIYQVFELAKPKCMDQYEDIQTPIIGHRIGQVFRHKNIPLFNLNEGRLVLYNKIRDSLTGKEIVFQSQLPLDFMRQMTEIQILEVKMKNEFHLSMQMMIKKFMRKTQQIEQDYTLKIQKTQLMKNKEKELLQVDIKKLGSQIERVEAQVEQKVLAIQNFRWRKQYQVKDSLIKYTGPSTGAMFILNQNVCLTKQHVFQINITNNLPQKFKFGILNYNAQRQKTNCSNANSVYVNFQELHKVDRYNSRNNSENYIIQMFVCWQARTIIWKGQTNKKLIENVELCKSTDKDFRPFIQAYEHGCTVQFIGSHYLT